jgi:DNA adenine methylase
MRVALPHPIPYQGSKRRLAGRILGVVGQRTFATLYEPFAGSAALTIAAADRGVAERHVVGDSLPSLVALWDGIVAGADAVADGYEELWTAQQAEGGRAHYGRIRDEFNADGDPVKLLYLLARCVKNAPRFGPSGFNQTADHRRRGTHPRRMRLELQRAGALLAGTTTTFTGDARACVAGATADDLVYLDPPWQGTSESAADPRYHQGYARTALEGLLDDLNARGVPWLLSYDGRTGTRTYGAPLDPALFAEHLELPAGRSSQSTLGGGVEQTVESLYVSAALSAAQPPSAVTASVRVVPFCSSSS